MAAGIKRNKKKRDHAGRPPKIARAYPRNLLEAKFIPGREYTMAFICEQLNEKVPTNNQMRTRIWDQMRLAGAVWERVRGSKYYLYKGLKDKPRDYGNYNASMCAKKRIIEAFGMDEHEYTITDYMNYNDLCSIYYKKNIQDILLPTSKYNQDSIEFKATMTLNRIIRNTMYGIFWKDFDNWKNNKGHPEFNILIPERRNQVIKRYRYNANGEITVSDNETTKEIRKKHLEAIMRFSSKRLLYGKRRNLYEELKRQGIEVYCSVWKIQFVKDVPSKYYCDENGIQKTLEQRLQKHVYKYLKSDSYNKEILIEKEYDKKVFDDLVWKLYYLWTDSGLKYKATDEELDQSINRRKENLPDTESDVIIGEDGDIETDEDFISFEYEYEIEQPT